MRFIGETQFDTLLELCSGEGSRSLAGKRALTLLVERVSSVPREDGHSYFDEISVNESPAGESEEKEGKGETWRRCIVRWCLQSDEVVGQPRGS